MSSPTPNSETTPIPLDLSAIEQVQWDIYDPDPHHLWNRIGRHFFSRITSEGEEFGQDTLDPLLWHDSTYLLIGDSYHRAVELLDEFLSTGGAMHITDPLKRAVFQRDLWAVFDWLIIQDDHSDQREALRGRLARIIREVALADEQIGALPDNYARAVDSGHFYTSYVPDDPRAVYLPSDLMQTDSQWMALGREGGPLALSHTEEFPFYGRSVFLVLIRVPGRSAGALEFAQQINRSRSLRAPAGLEVALVRKALLINTDGQIVPSPLTESVQIRRFRQGGLQDFYKFVLRRELLFTGLGGGLQPAGEELMIFRSHGDPFQFGPEFIHAARIPETCKGCHEDGGMGILGPRSILSISRARFPLADGQLPAVIETTSEREAQLVIAWKKQHPTWIALVALLEIAEEGWVSAS